MSPGPPSTGSRGRATVYRGWPTSCSGCTRSSRSRPAWPTSDTPPPGLSRSSGSAGSPRRRSRPRWWRPSPASGWNRPAWRLMDGCMHSCSSPGRGSRRVRPVTNTLSTRTFGNEDLLPRVPLPTLADTCALFLEWCAPLLTPSELATTRSAVAAFQAGPGPVLHAALEAYDQSPGVYSWLDTFWPYRYLGRRDRIALNANFFFLFAETGQSQLDRAAFLIASALEYKARLDREEIPPIVQRGQALTMEQNKFLFSETRIPGAVQDTVRVPYSQDWPGPSRERHIVV